MLNKSELSINRALFEKTIHNYMIKYNLDIEL